MQVSTLLVPVDFSSHSRGAFDYALDLAEHFGSQLHLLHAYQSPSAIAAFYGGGLPLDLDDRVRDAAAERLVSWQADGEKRGVATETHLSAIDATTAITNLADLIDADWIVMGTHGFSGLAHLALGSVAERVVRLAHCAVLTVNPETATPG